MKTKGNLKVGMFFLSPLRPPHSTAEHVLPFPFFLRDYILFGLARPSLQPTSHHDTYILCMYMYDMIELVKPTPAPAIYVVHDMLYMIHVLYRFDLQQQQYLAIYRKYVQLLW